MKKDSLLKMKDLPATEEMLAVAREDVPVKVGSGWNTSYRCRYSGFARSSVEGGILKVTLYDPDAMRLGGTLPVYEIFMEKEKQQFLTYDRAHDKWRTAKIDYLEWQAKGSNNVWISAVDDAQIRQYLVSDEKNVYRAILKFQRAVRDAELERRHRKETDPWDAELSQTPPLPKDWERWVNKVGIQENYIFYDYRKGGARYGYCTYCEKEVALKQRPYHNAVGKCPRCRHKITFKAKGKITDYLHSPTECAYLAQKCGDGFVVRQFQVSRQYRKEENTITSKTSSFEKQRIFYRADLSSHSYYWGWYKQRRTRWVEGIDEYVYTGMGYSYNEYCYQPGSIYGKTFSSIAPLLARTGLREYVRLCRGCVSPNWYLFAWGRFPRVEQICKANLPRLTTECLEDFGAVKSCIRQESETSLVKALALDTNRLSRLRRSTVAPLCSTGCSGRNAAAESSRIMCCTGWSRRRSMFPISTSFWIECQSSRSATIFSVRKAAHGIPCGRLFSHGGITFPWRTSWESTPMMRSYTVSSCCASVTMNWWSSCGKENGTWKLPQQQESIGKLQASAA